MYLLSTNGHLAWRDLGCSLRFFLLFLCLFRDFSPLGTVFVSPAVSKETEGKASVRVMALAGKCGPRCPGNSTLDCGLLPLLHAEHRRPRQQRGPGNCLYTQRTLQARRARQRVRRRINKNSAGLSPVDLKKHICVLHSSRTTTSTAHFAPSWPFF